MGEKKCVPGIPTAIKKKVQSLDSGISLQSMVLKF